MATKVTPELEEMLNLENAMERSYNEFDESETGSSVSTKSSHGSFSDSRAKAEWEKQLDKDFSEIEDRILRSTVELQEAYNSLKSRKKKKLENDKLSEKNSVTNGNVDGSLEIEEKELRSLREKGKDLEGTEFKESRIPLENYNLKNGTSVSNGSEGKISNKHIAEIEELEDESLNETVEQELGDETGASKNSEKNNTLVKNENKVLKLANEKDFYASQERILRKIQKLEEQRKSSSSLKSDDQRNEATALNVDAVNNKQIEEKKNVYVLPENKIINRHEEERDIAERKDEISRALDRKVNVDATQKSDVSDSAKRTQISKSRTDAAVDDGQEEKVINKVEEDEKDILEKQDTILRKALKLEEELEERQKALKLEEELEEGRKSESSKLMEQISSCRIDTVDDRQAETCIPLMDEEAVSIDLNEERGTSAEESQKNANGKTKWKYFRSLSSAKKSSVDFSDMRKRMRDGRNAASKACTCCTVVALSLCLSVLYVALKFGMAIAMIVIGTLYMKECPVQPHIPIYLVVGGAFGIFYNFISAFRQRDKKSYSCFDWIMILFWFIWFILGCVWVYSVKHVEFYVTTDPDYCHKTCYYFAFWFLNAFFILVGASLGLACCAGCCGCLAD